MRVEHLHPWAAAHDPHAPQGPGIVSAADIFVTGGARLRLKAVVFERQSDLRHFWRTCSVASELRPKCLGAVNGLGYERIDVAGGRERSTLVCDPRYFAIMGWCWATNMEIVTHESVHAAFAYAAGTTRISGSRSGIWKRKRSATLPASSPSGSMRGCGDEGLYERKGRPWRPFAASTCR